MPTTCFDAADVLAAQKALRMRLLDRHSAISWRAGRELAAQLLLHIDDPMACWQLAVEWMCGAFDVERVDGGYATPAQHTYELGRAEARRSDLEIHSLQGIAIDNHDPGVASIWSSSRPVVFSEIAQAKRLGKDLRQRLTAVGTAAKIAVALRENGTPFALLCIDHVQKRRNWTADQYACFQSLSAEVLGPILWAAEHLQKDACVHVQTGDIDDLTPAELRVAMLAATGMSYKEIARSLNRSFSTVDHQLRSIRRKLGVQSCTRLARLLAIRSGAA